MNELSRPNHHALLYVGPPEVCRARIPHEYQVGADADVLAVDTLTIDDARALALKAAHRPVESDKRRFIISVVQITLEAQNALLKLFEDPPASAQFYLIVPRLSVLIPTLRSRVQVAFEDGTSAEALLGHARTFIARPLAERLEEIALLQKTKDTRGMRALIAAIETYAAADPLKHATVLSVVEQASRYAELRGAAHKMLLEHLALSLPVVR